MCNENDILEVLREVLDPEMPISIVDLGMVERVCVRPLAPEQPAGDPGRGASDDRPCALCGTGEPASQASVEVCIDLLPTFVGCPALDMIRDDVQRRVGDLPGVARVTVRFLNTPVWSTDRISAAGRRALRAHGVTVPDGREAAPVPCPFCGGSDTRLESRFGPTRCRMIYYCNACRNSFEHLKRL